MQNLEQMVQESAVENLALYHKLAKKVMFSFAVWTEEISDVRNGACALAYNGRQQAFPLLIKTTVIADLELAPRDVS